MMSTKQASWRRTATESATIILSILLAFAIDANWDAFKERRQEHSFLTSLLSDFKETRDRIEASADEHTRYMDLAHQLLELKDGSAVSIEPEALEAMLGAVFFNWELLNLSSGSLDALFASGDIEIIGNPKLRALLAVWPSKVADTIEDDIANSADVTNTLAPYLNSKIRTRNLVRTSNSKTAEMIKRVESLSYADLWSDPMFENLLASRILNESYAVSEHIQLREAANEIILVIEDELGR